MTSIQEMPDLNPGWNIIMEVFHGLPQFLYANARRVHQIRPQLFPSTFHIPYNQSSY